MTVTVTLKDDDAAELRQYILERLNSRRDYVPSHPREWYARVANALGLALGIEEVDDEPRQARPRPADDGLPLDYFPDLLDRAPRPR